MTDTHDSTLAQIGAGANGNRVECVIEPESELELWKFVWRGMAI